MLSNGKNRAIISSINEQGRVLCCFVCHLLRGVPYGIYLYAQKTCADQGKEHKRMKKLEEYVRSIPDFPEEGIIFRDVTSVLQDADGMHLAIDSMQELL